MGLFSWEIIKQIFTPAMFMYMSIGTIVGLFIGALPGLGDNLAIALLLPFTLRMTPLSAIVMLICLYMAAAYGGSISSISIGVPGTGMAVSTLFDGLPMARKGEPGRAMAISLSASFFGGLVGVAALMFLTTALVGIIYKLTDPEIACITAFGLIGVASINSKNAAKGMVSVLLGLLLGTVGLDPISGSPRFTMGKFALYDGFSLVPVVIGLYAITRVIESLVAKNPSERREVANKNYKVRLAPGDLKKCFPMAVLGSIIGVIIGIIPGLGGGPATVFAYNTAKSFKGNKDPFGTGDPRGIAVVESANNAVVGGALIPYLTMGIAGSGSIAVAGSALIMQGIEPGVRLLKNNANLVYGLMWGLLIGTILMLIYGLLATSFFVRFLAIPDSLMAPVLLFFSFAGAFVTRYSLVDVWMALGIGVVAYFATKLGYSASNFIVSFILAQIFEQAFRRSLLISRGDWMIFINRPICLVFIILSVLIMVIPLISKAITAFRSEPTH